MPSKKKVCLRLAVPNAPFSHFMFYFGVILQLYLEAFPVNFNLKLKLKMNSKFKIFKADMLAAIR